MRYRRGAPPAATPKPSNRAEIRQSVFLVARVLRTGGSVAARVRNISARGAMLDIIDAAAFRDHEIVEVEIHGLGRQRARIAWRRSGKIGLAFEQIVDPGLTRRSLRQDKPS